MQIEVLASSSKGNAYIIRGNNDSLLLEAGLPVKELKRLLGYELPKYCLLTHSHKDHSLSAKELQRLGVNIWCSMGTACQIDSDVCHVFTINVQDTYYQTPIGYEFVVYPFKIEHDCPEQDPLGYMIYHKPSQKRILFATDTAYIKYQITGINIALIECNYSKDILDSNEINPTLRDRIVQSHMSLETCKGFFKANNLDDLEHVVLLHLSDNNSDEERFKKEIHEVVKVPVHIAEPGLKIKI